MQKTVLDAIRSYNEVIDIVDKNTILTVYTLQIFTISNRRKIFFLSLVLSGFAEYELAIGAASYCRTELRC